MAPLKLDLISREEFAALSPIEGIRDADLRESLEKARGTPAWGTSLSMYRRFQAERDAKRVADVEKQSRLALLPRDQRRRAVIREVIENEPTSVEHLRYMHSVMAVCPFPYRRLEEGRRDFERSQGKMSMVVEGGSLRTPDGRRMEQPVPFGPKARLILAYLTTEALRQKSARVEIADSLRGFMLDVGFDPTGGPRGNIKPFKEQLLAVSAARVEISSWDGRSADTIDESLFRRKQVWFDAGNLDQRSLWPSFVEWNPEIYKTLEEHAMPLDLRALRAFRNSCRKLDLYAWLAYRLHNLRADLTLTWEAVGKQFGDGFERQRDFRARFAEDVAAIREVFPKVPLVLSEVGVTLKKSDAGALQIPKRQLLKNS
jgi:hypothetical protein